MDVSAALSNALAKIRSYATGGAYSGDEKEAAAIGQTLPGAPSPGSGEFVDPAAERYAGQYLHGFRGGSPLMAALANQFALADWNQTPEEQIRRKKAGEIAFLTGHNRAVLGQSEK